MQHLHRVDSRCWIVGAGAAITCCFRITNSATASATDCSSARHTSKDKKGQRVSIYTMKHKKDEFLLTHASTTDSHSPVSSLQVLMVHALPSLHSLSTSTLQRSTGQSYAQFSSPQSCVERKRCEKDQDKRMQQQKEKQKLNNVLTIRPGSTETIVIATFAVHGAWSNGEAIATLPKERWTLEGTFCCRAVLY